jgi:tripartite-type tricarboxylate transporter receptor subunit TctC
MTTVDDLQLVVHQKVRPLAINSDERHKNFPGVPTVKELGYPVPVVYTLAGIAGPLACKDVQVVLLDAITKAARNQNLCRG